MDGTVAAALRRAGIAPGDLAAVAVTVGPGLAMCLQARPHLRATPAASRPRPRLHAAAPTGAAQLLLVGSGCCLPSARAWRAGVAAASAYTRAQPRPRCRAQLAPERAQGHRAELGSAPRWHSPAWMPSAHGSQWCAAPAGGRAQGAAAGGRAPAAAGARAPHGGARAGAARTAAGARPAQKEGGATAWGALAVLAEALRPCSGRRWCRAWAGPAPEPLLCLLASDGRTPRAGRAHGRRARALPVPVPAGQRRAQPAGGGRGRGALRAAGRDAR